MGPTWGLPWSCRPQMGHMLVSWTQLSGNTCSCRNRNHVETNCHFSWWKWTRVISFLCCDQIYRKTFVFSLIKAKWRTLQGCYNEHDGVSNHWRLKCLPKRLFRPRSTKKSKLRVAWPLWEEFTGEFSTQRTSNAENFSDDVIIYKRHLIWSLWLR